MVYANVGRSAVEDLQTGDRADGGPQSGSVQPVRTKVETFRGEYEEDDEVLARHPRDGGWSFATVKSVSGEGKYLVRWEHFDGEASEVGLKDLKLRPIPVLELEVGAKHVGKLVSVRDFGVFVDIGAMFEGFVHKSRIRDKSKRLRVGQVVDVWVTEVQSNDKFSLTMIEGARLSQPPTSESDYPAFEGISTNEWLEGTVEGLSYQGAFVRVKSTTGAEATGFVHVSAIREGYVQDVSSELHQGQKVKVRVLGVDVSAGKLSLSMKKKRDFAGTLKADLSRFAELSPEQWIRGRVTRLSMFGAGVAVTLEDGSVAEGLVPINQIRDGFVDSVEEELRMGQDVNVRAISVNARAGRLSLSMKEI